MKQGLHPKLKETKVVCNGCNTTFTTKATVDNISVEICSSCHPFFTGKEKLVDVAGRVDRFKAKQEAAKKIADSKKTKKDKQEKTEKKQTDSKEELKQLKKELKQGNKKEDKKDK